jgi:hypothetical protein
MLILDINDDFLALIPFLEDVDLQYLLEAEVEGPHKVDVVTGIQKEKMFGFWVVLVLREVRKTL